MRGVVREEWTQDSVRSCRHPARAEPVTARAKPPEKSKGMPESGGRPGSGEGRTGERKMSESADASIESKVIETLIETMMLDHTRSGACGRLRLKNTEDLGVE